MSSNSSMDNLFQAMQVVLSVAPVPGIAAAAIAIQEIYKLVKAIALREAECQALLNYACAVLTVMNNHSKSIQESELAVAVNNIRGAIELMHLDMNVWRNYGRGMGYLKNNEILEGIKRHRANLDKALGMVGLAHALEQTEWNQRFFDAQMQDRQMLEQISSRQEEMYETVQQLQQLLSQKNSMTAEAENSRAHAQRQLYQLRSGRMDTAVLPPRTLLNEVQKMGPRAVHAGSMYDIWKGMWLDQHFVALKVFRGTNPSEKDSTRMNRQVDLWRALSHPNILQLYGICQLDSGPTPPLYFVSPWMWNRDIMAYIEKHPNIDRLKLIHDVLKGLKYLHSVSILHGGLQGSNVLVDQEGNAVLSDFSLSKIMDPNVLFTHSNGPQSSLRWMAPEAHNLQAMSSRTDVYSWGMTALQILTGKVPFYKIKAVGKVVIAIAIKNAKPDRADYAGTSLLIQNDRVWNLLSSCWVADPDKRPSVDELIAEVASL